MTAKTKYQRTTNKLYTSFLKYTWILFPPCPYSSNAKTHTYCTQWLTNHLRQNSAECCLYFHDTAQLLISLRIVQKGASLATEYIMCQAATRDLLIVYGGIEREKMRAYSTIQLLTSFLLSLNTQSLEASVLFSPFLFSKRDGLRDAAKHRHVGKRPAQGSKQVETCSAVYKPMFQHSTDGRYVTMQWDVTAFSKKYKEMALSEQTGYILGQLWWHFILLELLFCQQLQSISESSLNLFFFKYKTSFS